MTDAQHADDVRQELAELADIVLVLADGSRSKYAVWDRLNRLINRLIEPHEPDNERGVWCCQEHREEFNARRLNDGLEEVR